jgi:phytoene dehydrogenase-like protein
VPEVVAAHAVASGVKLRVDARVARIVTERGVTRGVVLASGEELSADAVLSNVHGVGTYLDLLDTVGARFARELRSLPLQSPGVAAYLEVRSAPPPPPYLRFWIPGAGAPGVTPEACRLLIAPPAADSTTLQDGRWCGRLLMPMRHEEASALDAAGQDRLLDAILDEPWWKTFAPEARVVGRRIPTSWGTEHHLHRESMNPVMTARFMRKGRIAHESPQAERLFLAGSATHPGQWVSFAAISGILAADRLLAKGDIPL